MKNLSSYQKLNRRRILLLCVLALVLFAVLHIAIILGAYSLAPRDILLFWTEQDSIAHRVILQIRLPRVVAAGLTGGVLSMAGAVCQSLMRNPLASPFTLGISGSAAFGAAFGIVFLVGLFPSNFPTHYVVGASAFLWSLVSIGFILLFTRTRRASPHTLLLTGVVLSSLFSAGISGLQYFSTDLQLSSIVFWQFGDMGRAEWTNIALVTGGGSLAILFFFKRSWQYATLKAGDDFAKSLGLNPGYLRTEGMILASLITALSVSFYGIISFVGLLGPHITRRIIGGHEPLLIPASGLFGAILLIVADTLGRTIISPIVLPVGIITSFLGAPLFLYLLLKAQR